MSIEKANFVRFSGNELYIEFAANNKYNQATWEKPENAKVLQEILRPALGRDAAIVVSVSGLQIGTQQSPEELQKKQERDELWRTAEADPLVQEVLKVFRGKILDVIVDETVEETEELQQKAG
jgi:hypothetical protein